HPLELCLRRACAPANRPPRIEAVVHRRAACMTMTAGAVQSSKVPREEAAGVGLFEGYTLGSAYDEMFGDATEPRAHYRPLYDLLRHVSSREFRQRKAMTDASMRQDGV